MKRKSTFVAFIAGVMLAVGMWIGEASAICSAPFDVGVYCNYPVYPVDPSLQQAFFGVLAPSINNGFSFGPDSFSGLNNINALISGIGGTAFVPLVNPLGNLSAASSSDLNFLLGLAGQMTLPFLPGGFGSAYAPPAYCWSMGGYVVGC